MAFVWDDLAPFEIFLEISETGKEERRKKKMRLAIFNEVSIYLRTDLTAFHRFCFSDVFSFSDSYL